MADCGLWLRPYSEKSVRGVWRRCTLDEYRKKSPAWETVLLGFQHYLTMLGAPWLVRKRGHVHVELVTAMLPRPLQTALSRAVAGLCVAVCVVLAWYGIELVSQNIERAAFDVRAYFTPKWWLTIAFPLSFGLMAVEFARFVFGPDLMHSGEAGIHE